MHQGTKIQKISSDASGDDKNPCPDADVLANKTIFQTEYGVLIYNYPMRFLKMDSEKAGDFYLYVFEKDRIFKRLAHFRGERISLVNYLKYYVLKDMCMEWLRATSPQLNTESLDDPESDLENRLTADDDYHLREKTPWLDCFLQIFKQPAFLILRILYLADFPVSTEDVRQIAAKTGRELTDVVKWIAGIEHQLGEKVAAVDSRSDQLAVIHWHRLAYQKRLIQIESELLAAGHNNQTSLIRKLNHEKLELERKYAWRLHQTEIFMADISDQSVTMAYKDIAELMMTTIGAVSAKIYKTKARLKAEVIRLCGKDAAC
jgi:hypothetical protein